MSDSNAPTTTPDVGAERAFTPGSNCKVGRGSRCGNPNHSGSLIDRDDGTRSCKIGFVRSSKCQPCTDGCGATVHQDEWHAVNPLAVAQFVAGGIVRPVLTGGTDLFNRFFRVVKSPADTVLTPKCAAQIAAHVNAKDKEKAGYVRTQTREGVATEGAWLPLFVTADQIKTARRKAAAPIIALIEQVQRGRFVQRGEPTFIGGILCQPCTAAVNGNACLGDGFGVWDTMPAWSSPKGDNHIGFCQTCADAVAHRFTPKGLLKDLITGAGRQEEAPRPDRIATIGEVAGRVTRNSAPLPDCQVILADSSPWDRINATRRLAEGHLPEAGTARVIAAIQRLRTKSGDKVSHADATRIDGLYEQEVEAMRKVEDVKQTDLSEGHREAATAHSRKAAVRMLKGLGAVDTDFIIYSDDECTVVKAETPKELYDRVSRMLEDRKATALRDAAIKEAVKLGMYPDDATARNAFGFDLAVINADIAAWTLANGGGQGDLTGLPTPPQKTPLMKYAEMLATNGGVTVTVHKPKADPNAAGYGECKVAPKPKKGGNAQPKTVKAARAPRGGSSREGAVAAQ